MWNSQRQSAGGGEVVVVVGADFEQRVAAEFFQEGAGDLEGDDVFHDDAGGGNGRDVAALPAGFGGFLGVEIDGFQRLAEGGDRFHRAADDDRFAVGHAAFQAAGVV